MIFIQRKLRGLDKQMEDDEDVFVDAHDESIDQAIMEAAGVDDNSDKMVESIQIKSRQDSIKDSRSSWIAAECPWTVLNLI